MGKKIHIEESLLKQKLYDEGKSQAAIARELGVDVRVVRARIRELELLSRREYKQQSLTYDILYQKYIIEGKSVKTLYKELGCPRDWLRARLKELGLLREASYHAKDDDRLELSYDLLYEQYVIKKKPISHIARELGYKPSTVRRHLKKHGLYESKTSFDGMNTANIDAAKIKDEMAFRFLVENGATVSELAVHFNCSQDTVYRKKQELGLDNGIKDISKEKLEKEYLDKKRSCEDIARDYNCSGGTIRNRLIEYGISLRDSAEMNRIELDIDIIRYYLEDGMSYAAIAEVCGCSMGTIRNFSINNGLDILLKSTTSTYEFAIENNLKAVDLPYVKHERQVLHGKEIDFVIEGVIGIEVSPCATHNSDKGIHDSNPKDPSYHVDKTRLARDEGIVLLTKFDWFNNETIITRARSLLNNEANLTNMISKTSIFETRTFIEILSHDESVICQWEAQEIEDFKWRLALSSNANSDMDSLRTIPLAIEELSDGGAHSIEYIADIALGDDVILKELGFKTVDTIPPVMRYVSKHGTQWMTLDGIVDMFPELPKDDHELQRFMNDNGYYRVFDCGSVIMELAC